LGKILAKGDEAAVVESVKAASEVYAPVSGEVIEINNALERQPDLVNTDPIGTGWFFKIKLSNLVELEGLMEEAAYQSLTEQGH
jgi:glycine cleavage system H protein